MSSQWAVWRALCGKPAWEAAACLSERLPLAVAGNVLGAQLPDTWSPAWKVVLGVGLASHVLTLGSSLLSGHPYSQIMVIVRAVFMEPAPISMISSSARRVVTAQ